MGTIRTILPSALADYILLSAVLHRLRFRKPVRGDSIRLHDKDHVPGSRNRKQSKTMGTLLANTCWPARYPAKWAALFAGGLFAGTVVGVQARLRAPHPPIRQVQVGIRVYTKYVGETADQPANANVFFGRERADMRPNQVIRVHSGEAALRTQAAGVPIDFMVQPLDAVNKEEGQPVHLEVTWPKTTDVEVVLRVERPYARPKR